MASRFALVQRRRSGNSEIAYCNTTRVFTLKNPPYCTKSKTFLVKMSFTYLRIKIIFIIYGFALCFGSKKTLGKLGNSLLQHNTRVHA